jgi:predicted Rossmann fold nucleotide-binding protein DprA/Smf involved in DNA uptake
MPSPATLPSRDTQATLLLVARLGDKPSVPPLNRREYNALAHALRQQDLRPGDLLTHGGIERLKLDPRIATLDRIEFLLDRGSALAFRLDSWASMGLWVVSRGDAEYPTRIRKRLRLDAPPVFYGAGPIEPLQGDGIGIVGSRDLDEAGADFARAFGQLCVAQGLAVISGAARGADSEAMLAAVNEGGHAIGVLAGDLERLAMSKQWRSSVRNERVTLLSAFEPTARFTVGYAMERNRYIYALSRFVTVVASAAGEGGTWAGAIENLDAGWVPLVVRADPRAPTGNEGLLHHGATPLYWSQVQERIDLRALYRTMIEHQRRTAHGIALELPFTKEDVSLPEAAPADDAASQRSKQEGSATRAPMRVNERGRFDPHGPSADVSTDLNHADVHNAVALSRDISPEPGMPNKGGKKPKREEPKAGLRRHHIGTGIGRQEVGSGERGELEIPGPTDVLTLLLPILQQVAATPRSVDELTAFFPDVMPAQLKAWLSRAVATGSLRKEGRPPRYVAP